MPMDAFVIAHYICQLLMGSTFYLPIVMAAEKPTRRPMLCRCYREWIICVKNGYNSCVLLFSHQVKIIHIVVVHARTAAAAPGIFWWLYTHSKGKTKQQRELPGKFSCFIYNARCLDHRLRGNKSIAGGNQHAKKKTKTRSGFWLAMVPRSFEKAAAAAVLACAFQL